jgi:hypothetical protein
MATTMRRMPAKVSVVQDARIPVNTIDGSDPGRVEWHLGG